MNLETVYIWVDIVQGVGTIGVWAYVWWMNRKQRFDARFHRVETRLEDHGDRLKDVEGACKHAPGHNELGKVYERINDVAGQVGRLAGEMKANGGVLARIEECLLHKNGGK